MAVNLNKYRDSIISAWKEVINDNISTDWALFSYEGQTNDLKVVSKGDGGLEELKDELNSGKIMYAFCRVLDPKTSLHKFLLINWTGEGAPTLRKGTCANHIRDVNALLKGAHLTISARNDEEVDPDVIIEKVSKSTSSVYRFDQREETNTPSGPVGTTYKKVIPQQEINAKERDTFWQREEEEEKKRLEQERQIKEEERRKLESERQQREIEEAVTREAKIQERSNSITMLREAEKQTIQQYTEPKLEETDDREYEEYERRNRSEELKRIRSQEAQALISKRTIDARAVFEQNTAAGQLHNKKSSFQTSTVTNTAGIEEERWSQEPDTINVPHTHNNSSELKENDQSRPEFLEDHVIDNTEEEENESNKEDNSLYARYNDPNTYENDTGIRAKALYSYTAADETEISFSVGEDIFQIELIDKGWWQGLGPDGKFGLFPANYVQLQNL